MTCDAQIRSWEEIRRNQALMSWHLLTGEDQAVTVLPGLPTGPIPADAAGRFFVLNLDAGFSLSQAFTKAATAYDAVFDFQDTGSGQSLSPLQTWSYLAAQRDPRQREKLCLFWQDKAPEALPIVDQYLEAQVAYWTEKGCAPITAFAAAEGVTLEALDRTTRQLTKILGETCRTLWPETRRGLFQEPADLDWVDFFSALLMENPAIESGHPRCFLPDSLLDVFGQWGFGITGIRTLRIDPDYWPLSLELAVHPPYDQRVILAQWNPAHICHELGHALHHANIHPHQPAELRYPSPGICETFSYLFESLIFERHFTQGFLGLDPQVADSLRRHHIFQWVSLALLSAMTTRIMLTHWQEEPLSAAQMCTLMADTFHEHLGFATPPKLLLPGNLNLNFLWTQNLSSPGYLLALSRLGSLWDTLDGGRGWWHESSGRASVRNLMSQGQAACFPNHDNGMAFSQALTQLMHDL